MKSEDFKYASNSNQLIEFEISTQIFPFKCKHISFIFGESSESEEAMDRFEAQNQEKI